MIGKSFLTILSDHCDIVTNIIQGRWFRKRSSWGSFGSQSRYVLDWKTITQILIYLIFFITQLTFYPLFSEFSWYIHVWQIFRLNWTKAVAKQYMFLWDRKVFPSDRNIRQSCRSTCSDIYTGTWNINFRKLFCFSAVYFSRIMYMIHVSHVLLRCGTGEFYRFTHILQGQFSKMPKSDDMYLDTPTALIYGRLNF